MWDWAAAKEQQREKSKNPYFSIYLEINVYSSSLILYYAHISKGVTGRHPDIQPIETQNKHMRVKKLLYKPKLGEQWENCKSLWQKFKESDGMPCGKRFDS